MRRALWAPYGLSRGCNAGILSSGTHDLLFRRSLSTSQVYRCPLFPCFPLISTVSLITGAIRAARVISAYARTPLSRARSIRSLLGSRWDSAGTSRDPQRFPSSSFTAIVITPKGTESSRRRTRGELSLLGKISFLSLHRRFFFTPLTIFLLF